MAATPVNKFFTGLGVPPLSPCRIKKREREIGPMVEALAKESCKAAKEKKLHSQKRLDLESPRHTMRVGNAGEVDGLITVYRDIRLP